MCLAAALQSFLLVFEPEENGTQSTGMFNTVS
jgi:hypothetical protein